MSSRASTAWHLAHVGLLEDYTFTGVVLRFSAAFRHSFKMWKLPPSRKQELIDRTESY